MKKKVKQLKWLKPENEYRVDISIRATGQIIESPEQNRWEVLEEVTPPGGVKYRIIEYRNGYQLVIPGVFNALTIEDSDQVYPTIEAVKTVTYNRYCKAVTQAEKSYRKKMKEWRAAVYEDAE